MKEKLLTEMVNPYASPSDILSIVGWDFPSVIEPLRGTEVKSDEHNFQGVQYRLVARIQSTASSGFHFKTIARTTDDMIFLLDGQGRHTHLGIRNLSGNGMGSAPLLNLRKGPGRKARDLDPITGRKPMTVAAFYVLTAVDINQKAFWLHQAHILSRAEEAGPLILSRKGDVKPGSLENCAHTWIPENKENHFRLKELTQPELRLIVR